jgi:hypothetical protein
MKKHGDKQLKLRTIASLDEAALKQVVGGLNPQPTASSPTPIRFTPPDPC